MSNQLNRNIIRLYVIKASKWFMLFMPVLYLFYEENGLDTQDLFTLKAVYSVAVVLMEIPSGYLADVWGRKNTMIIGSIMGFAGFVVYSLTHSFLGFLIAEVILGVGQSFISGSDSALLYDSLMEKKREKEYVKFEGRVVSIGNFSEAIAAVLGGVIAVYSLRYTFYLQTVIAFLAIPASLTLYEPKTHKKLVTANFSYILNIVHYSLVKNKHLRYSILYSSIIGTSTLTMAWFAQPYFKEVGLPVVMFGTLWILLNASVGFSSIYAHKIENRLGEVKTVLLIIGGTTLGYIMLGAFTTLWAIAFLFFFYLVRGIATPVLKEYINRLSESETRATVLSVRNFIIRMNFAIVAPLIGWVSTHYSLSLAFNLAGIVFFIAVLSVFLFYQRFKLRQKNSGNVQQ